jgi:hypothetical protein
MRGGDHSVWLAAPAIAAALFAGAPCRAATVQISALQDLAFTNFNPLVDATRTENVCVFSDTLLHGYNVTARGSGSSSAFTLSASGPAQPLPYTVQWSGSAGGSSGTTLTAGTPLAGQNSLAITRTCSVGVTASATLIVILRTADLQAALSGVPYSGTLSLTIAPE